MEKLKYLQLGKFFPPNWGGIETVTYNLALGLIDRDEINAVIAFGNSNSTQLLSVDNRSTKVYLSKYVEFFRAPISISYFFNLRRLTSHYNVIILHLPNPLALISLMFSGYKGRVVLYWHSDIVDKGLLGWLLKPIERWAISRSNVVIAPTKAHLQFSMYSFLLQSKGRVVPYPIHPRLVEIANIRRDLPRTLLGKKQIRLLAIGRLVEYKGLEYLIRAIPFLRSKYNVHLDILGDGPLKDHLLMLISRLCIGQAVTLHGLVTEDERDTYLSEADIFCFPSITKQEMYGMAQVEAMAYGLPIISTEIVGSGSPELTRMTGSGIVVETESPQAIERAVETLIEVPSFYKDLSDAGLEAVTKIFAPALLVNQFCLYCQSDF